YFSSELNSYLSSKGILHQSTCPHTPQQNGIAERKNRHLVETARTLLFSTNVLTNNWGKAVLTTCFLINRMSYAFLENQIPHSILFPKDKIYHVPPKVFGCVVINSLQEQSNVCFLDIHVFKKGTNPIALRKGIRSTRNPHPIYLCYHCLSPSYFSFVSSVSSITIPKSICEALDHLGWQQTMIALKQSGTWELVPLPSSKKLHLTAQLITSKPSWWPKDILKYMVLIMEILSLVAKITIIRLLLAMAAICHWLFHQLDIKNIFLHGDLDEEIYMEQPPDFVALGKSGIVCKLHKSLYGLKQSLRAWFGRFSQVVQNFRMTRSETDHSVFYCHSSSHKCVYLVVYVDDIVITGNYDMKIFQLKQYLFNHFQTKDLGHLKYFLDIEVAQSKEDIVISQRKYVLDILQETSMSNCRLVNSPMDPNMKLMVKHGESYSDPKRYRRLVGKLIYLTITRPDISFAVEVVTVLHILRYIKKTPGQSLLYEDKGDTHILGYCDVDWAGSLIDRRSTIGEMWSPRKVRSKILLLILVLKQNIGLWLQPLRLFTLLLILYFMRTKHIEIDCHFVWKKLLVKEISTEFVNSSNQLADIFTKSLREPQIQVICSKLGAYNLYAPA
ncbi:Copia protein, partial [Mucuna pruriens]